MPILILYFFNNPIIRLSIKVPLLSTLKDTILLYFGACLLAYRAQNSIASGFKKGSPP